MSVLKSAEATVMRDLLRCKVFGENVDVIGYHLDDMTNLDDTRNPRLYLTLNYVKDGAALKKKLFVKFQPVEEVYNRLSMEVQFNNEILSYTEIFPLLNNYKASPLLPEYYFSTCYFDKRKYLVFEDLNDSGFVGSKLIFSSDLDHIKLAFEKLGRFHALSYAAKVERREEFFSAVKRIQEPHWVEGLRINLISVKNGVSRPGTNLPEKYADKYKRLCARVDEEYRFFLELVKPEEPIAVLCHGDFCLNNMMYRYRGDRPDDVKFIDFGTVRYASPVIDLSFFVFLNLSPEMRASHLAELLRVYHDSLANTVPGLSVPSLADVQEEFRRKCVYGFLHAIYYIPVMSAVITGVCPLDFLELVKASTDEDIFKELRMIGGTKGTELMQEMLIDFLENYFCDSL
uniref:CHK kinase-like domain-containing protein n=3 Tax=Clastoptera arizonana TaxID=38151 RepID=A0A1B6CJT9_9HEMI